MWVFSKAGTQVGESHSGGGNWFIQAERLRYCCRCVFSGVGFVGV
jgi:hypothetical protein